jgi:hypothetical protein
VWCIRCFLPTSNAISFLPKTVKGEPVLETIMRYGNKYQTDAAMAKNSLFGDMAEVEILKPEIPYVPDWSPLEKTEPRTGTYWHVSLCTSTRRICLRNKQHLQYHNCRTKKILKPCKAKHYALVVW